MTLELLGEFTSGSRETGQCLGKEEMREMGRGRTGRWKEPTTAGNPNLVKHPVPNTSLVTPKCGQNVDQRELVPIP